MDRLRLLLVSSLGLVLGAAAVIACTPAPIANNGFTTRPDRSDDDDDDTRGDDDDDDAVVKPEEDPELPDGGKPPGRIYAHTASALYLFDPIVRTLTKVGDFDGFDTTFTTERMLDLALDRDSAMYGTTDHGFVKIDPLSARITYIKKNATNFLFPNSLSFVPVGTVDRTKEALVGYIQKSGTFGPTTYVRVDLMTGNLTEIGELNATNAAMMWRSAGDIISTIRNGNKAYLTVQLFNPDGGTLTADPGTDSLAEVDPKTGKLIDIIGDIGQPNFYGLGQWAGTAYGFNEGGNIVEINMDTGAGRTLMTLKVDGGATGEWYGAGMTTDAPTKP